MLYIISREQKTVFSLQNVMLIILKKNVADLVRSVGWFFVVFIYTFNEKVNKVKRDLRMHIKIIYKCILLHKNIANLFIRRSC